MSGQSFFLSTDYFDVVTFVLRSLGNVDTAPRHILLIFRISNELYCFLMLVVPQVLADNYPPLYLSPSRRGRASGAASKSGGARRLGEGRFS
jgi:hypothetical protein